MTEDKRISQLGDPTTVETSDILPGLRSGQNVAVQVGSSGTKAASDASKDKVASVNGATVVGHLAVFSDTAGTVADGGAADAIITGATRLDIVLTTDDLVIHRNGVIYLASVDAVQNAQPPSGAGGQFDFSDSQNSAYAAII